MIARLTRVLYACGRACVRFRWLVIAAWIAVAVVLHLAAASAGEDWTDNLTLPGTGSTRATDLLQERLPQQAYGSIPISLRDPNGASASGARAFSTTRPRPHPSPNRFRSPRRTTRTGATMRPPHHPQPTTEEPR
jgi:hypothetical protein